MRANPRVPTDAASLNIRGLQVSLLGWQFPEATGDWDSNWLRICARYVGSGSNIELFGSLLDTVSFARFAEELASMQVSLTGSATLASVEPNFALVFNFSDQLGTFSWNPRSRCTGNRDHHQPEYTVDRGPIHPRGFPGHLCNLPEAEPDTGRKTFWLLRTSANFHFFLSSSCGNAPELSCTAPAFRRGLVGLLEFSQPRLKRRMTSNLPAERRLE